MFNAEKLLGTVLGQVLGTKGKKHSLLSSLTSGAGLMTVIGLGVGAYEILKEKQSQPQGMISPPPPPPGSQWVPGPPPPPFPPAATMPAKTPVNMQASPEGATALNPQELAIRMIQVMIAAAHADKILDEEEEKAILQRVKNASMSPEERLFLLDELHKPKDLDFLTAGIADPSIAKTMYMLAVTAVAIDTDNERAWLDKLAGQLMLSKGVQAFIEEQR